MKTDRRTVLNALVAGGVTASTGGPALGRERKEAPRDAMGLLYDATKCIGCQSCVAACCGANGGPVPDSTNRYVDMSAPRTRTSIQILDNKRKSSFVKSQCMHCIDPACASACMLGAMAKREHGAVTWDGNLCVGCRYCQVACPYNVPRFEWAEAFPKIVKCELCVDRIASGLEPACSEVCPRGAIQFGSYRTLSTKARTLVADEPDRYASRAYGLIEGGGTQVLYLSPADMTFEDLGLPNLDETPVAELSERLQHGIYSGAVVPLVLYAMLGAAAWRSIRANGNNNETKPDEESS